LNTQLIVLFGERRTAMTIENDVRDLEKEVEDLDCALQELRNQQQKCNTETMKFQK